MRSSAVGWVCDVLYAALPGALVTLVAVRQELPVGALLVTFMAVVAATARLRRREVGVWSAVLATAAFDAVRGSRLPRGTAPSGRFAVAGFVILLASAMVGSWRRAGATVPPSANVPGPEDDTPYAPTARAAATATYGTAVEGARDIDETRVPALVG